MLLVDGNGLPCGASIDSASPHEVNLIEPLLEHRVLRRKPIRLLYDGAADSDPLRKRLARRGIELIAPQRKGRAENPHRTEENSAVTNDAGKLSAPSVGSKTLGGLSCNMSSIITYSWDLFS